MWVSTMSSHQPNEKLPFDILGLVFTHYAQEETIWRPLETLLLVCRSWSLAALGHRALWSNFRIYLGHDETSITWNARLPLRLDRCESECLLDIDIRNILDLPNEEDAPEETQSDESYVPWTCDPTVRQMDPDAECVCFGVARECAESTLHTLAGLHGSLSARWRTLRLHLGQRGLRVGSKLLADALSHPTPNLTDLQFDQVCVGTESSGIDILPHATRVSRLIFLDCSFPSFPIFPGVVEASIGGNYIHPLDDGTPVLRTATQIQDLRLLISTNSMIALPPAMHQLRTLSIEGTMFPPDLEVAEMPRLESISSWCAGDNLLFTILNCKGIDIGKIKAISLSPRDAFLSEADYVPIADSLLELLRQAKSLTHLSASGRLLEAILKIFWGAIKRGDFSGLFPSTSVPNGRAQLTDLTSGDSFEFEGKETTEMLNALSRHWRLATPDLSMDSFPNLFSI